MKAQNQNPLALTLFSFIILIFSPQALTAATSDIRDCLTKVQLHWPQLSLKTLSGETRHKTNCALEVKASPSSLEILAEGEPLEIQFTLGNLENWKQTLQSCKVDTEKLHLVFEQKSRDSFERKEKIQLTLLKRKGLGLSMILSQKQLKVFMPVNQSNLICHLQP